ncbi:hypothetical protein ACFVWY_33840 [Streptomyces sp. NPDC058195]|uniref:hypothetical protein n=1 Tax=Streptomyces sp. NPDC058195 TaxID=3346375 RepID=UPI0036E02A10
MNVYTALRLADGLSSRMLDALHLWASSPQGSTGRTNNGRGGGTHGAMVRRALISLGVDETGRAGYFLTPKAWAFLRALYGTTRPADADRLTVDQARTEAYTTHPAPAAPRSGEVVIPGALADFLAGTNMAAGGDDHDPECRATRAALDAGRRGRGRTLIIPATSTTVLNVISEYAQTLLAADENTAAERAAARTWIERAGHARRSAAAVETVEQTAEKRAERRQQLADSRGGNAYELAVAAVRRVVREMPRAGALRVRVIEATPETSLARDDLHALAYSGHTTADAVTRVRAAVAAHVRHGEREVHVMFPAHGMRPALYLADVMALLHRWDDNEAKQARIDARTAEPAAARRVIEGVIVEHNGTTRGTAPRHAADSDALAALAALAAPAPLRLADVTDHTDITARPGDRDHAPAAWGYLIEPRGNGRIALYWIEAGRHVRPNGEPFAVELEIGADKLRAAGWTIEPRIRRCVMAWRPE